MTAAARPTPKPTPRPIAVGSVAAKAAREGTAVAGGACPSSGACAVPRVELGLADEDAVPGVEVDVEGVLRGVLGVEVKGVLRGVLGVEVEGVLRGVPDPGVDTDGVVLVVTVGEGDDESDGDASSTADDAETVTDSDGVTVIVAVSEVEIERVTSGDCTRGFVGSADGVTLTGVDVAVVGRGLLVGDGVSDVERVFCGVPAGDAEGPGDGA